MTSGCHQTATRKVVPHVLQRGARINPCARIQNVRDLEKVWGLGVVKGAVRVVGFNINLKKFKNNINIVEKDSKI